MLFSGTDELSRDVQQDDSVLGSRAAQERIAEYRQKLIMNNAQGKLLMPSGVSQYAMAAPWALDVFNAALKNAGGLSADKISALDAMSLGDKEAYQEESNQSVTIKVPVQTYYEQQAKVQLYASN